MQYRVTMVATISADRNSYDKDMSVEDMLSIERANAEADPYLYFEMMNESDDFVVAVELVSEEN